MRLALLEKIESKPHLLESYNELLELIAGRPDNAWFWGAAGLPHHGSGAWADRARLLCGGAIHCGAGAWRSGSMWAGFVCIALAILIAGFGVLIHWLSREAVAGKK